MAYTHPGNRTNALLSCVSPHFRLNAADGTELCALAAALRSVPPPRRRSTARTLTAQWTGIFTHPQATHASCLWQPVSLTAWLSSLNPTRFVIRHTVADPLEARICNWILEHLAHTFEIALCVRSCGGEGTTTCTLSPFLMVLTTIS